MAPECCCRRPHESVLSVGEVQRQRMHGHQFAGRFLVGRGRRCWRRAVKSVMECWWPVWAGWWCSPEPDQLGPHARRVCTRFVAWQEANVTPKGRELHGRVVSGRARVSPPRAGLSGVVPMSLLEIIANAWRPIVVINFLPYTVGYFSTYLT